MLELKESRGNDLIDSLVDCTDRPSPVTHVERPEGRAVGSDPGAWRDGLRVDDDASLGEDGVDVAQGVHDALKGNASQRPTAKRDVEPLTWKIERFGAMTSEADSIALLIGESSPCLGDVLGARVECEDLRCACGSKPSETPVTAADIEHSLPV